MTKFPSLGTNQFSDNPIRISDISRVLRKYGIYILGSTILGAILAATWAHFQPSLYDATSMIHLDQHSSISIGPAGASTDEYALKLQTQIVGFCGNFNFFIVAMATSGFRNPTICVWSLSAYSSVLVPAGPMLIELC